jgi:arylsulfatase A-like enzyme
MSYFEASARVPLLVHYPKLFKPNRVPANVSTLDILPTLVDLSSTKLCFDLPMDGKSLMPHLQGHTGHDTVFAEYCGEGTISPIMMIRRGPWKYIVCPADPPQLYNLDTDPLELVNLAQGKAPASLSAEEVGEVLKAFNKEAHVKWDFEKISQDVLRSQRQRRLIWGALKQGKFTSWDYSPVDDGKEKRVEPRSIQSK